MEVNKAKSPEDIPKLFVRAWNERSADGIAQLNLFLFVVYKHGEHWLCVSAQNTDIVAGAETHIRRDDGTLVAVDYRK